MISVIIPTYKEPDYLDLCLQSAIQNQKLKNEIIVVVDGFYSLNKPILDKHKDSKLDNLNAMEQIADDVLHTLAICGLKFHNELKNSFEK